MSQNAQTDSHSPVPEQRVRRRVTSIILASRETAYIRTSLTYVSLYQRQSGIHRYCTKHEKQKEARNDRFSAWLRRTSHQSQMPLVPVRVCLERHCCHLPLPHPFTIFVVVVLTDDVNFDVFPHLVSLNAGSLFD